MDFHLALPRLERRFVNVVSVWLAMAASQPLLPESANAGTPSGVGVPGAASSRRFDEPANARVPVPVAQVEGRAAASAGTHEHPELVPPIQKHKLRVVVFGGHPDDPETGCGGLIAFLAQAGHEVRAAYGTCFRGERRIGGEPEAVVRRREAAAACKILGATPKFFDYAHENLTADHATLDAVSAWLDEVKPDIVVTHWPLDTHPNHHAVSSLVWQCYRRQGAWNLYFFEVMTGRQTVGFRPELYLDIGEVHAIKKKACYCHASQRPDEFWAVHEAMHRRRGNECGVEFAEAYSLVESKPGCALLPVKFLGRK